MTVPRRMVCGKKAFQGAGRGGEGDPLVQGALRTRSGQGHRRTAQMGAGWGRRVRRSGSVVPDIGKINDELRPDGADLFAFIKTQRWCILFF